MKQGENGDSLYYLDNLKEWKQKLGCRVYAYCLMTNHVHLIVDPGEDARNLALLMKRVAGRQTRFTNKQEHRSGSLWEGRYKSSPIDTDEYLLACCRYVELNPVRVGLAIDPLARIFDDPDHSLTEVREIIIGHSIVGRLIMVSFVEKEMGLVRIISARQTTNKERADYEENI